MGYEVDVNGKITFHDIEGFKEAFEGIAQRRDSEVGMHGDYDYFFTRMWGNNLEDLKAVEGVEYNLEREGKMWYDDKAAMTLLSRFAEGRVEFNGEDGDGWGFILDGKGGIRRITKEWTE